MAVALSSSLLKSSFCRLVARASHSFLLKAKTITCHKSQPIGQNTKNKRSVDSPSNPQAEAEIPTAATTKTNWIGVASLASLYAWHQPLQSKTLAANQGLAEGPPTKASPQGNENGGVWWLVVYRVVVAIHDDFNQPEDIGLLPSLNLALATATTLAAFSTGHLKLCKCLVEACRARMGIFGVRLKG